MRPTDRNSGFGGVATARDLTLDVPVTCTGTVDGTVGLEPLGQHVRGLGPCVLWGTAPGGEARMIMSTVRLELRDTGRNGSGAGRRRRPLPTCG